MQGWHYWVGIALFTEMRWIEVTDNRKVSCLEMSPNPFTLPQFSNVKTKKNKQTKKNVHFCFEGQRTSILAFAKWLLGPLIPSIYLILQISHTIQCNPIQHRKSQQE